LDGTEGKILGLEIQQSRIVVICQRLSNGCKGFVASDQVRGSVNGDDVRYLEFRWLKSIGKDGGENDGTRKAARGAILRRRTEGNLPSDVAKEKWDVLGQQIGEENDIATYFGAIKECDAQGSGAGA
jgi:hypothetical protein